MSRLTRQLSDLYYAVTSIPKKVYQKLTRGFSDDEVWSLDSTIVKFTLPRLRQFEKEVHGYPYTVESLDNWKGMLLLMIHAMELYVEDMGGGILTEAEEELMKIGMDLFYEYFGSLWN